MRLRTAINQRLGSTIVLMSVSVLAVPASAHEFWLETQGLDFQPEQSIAAQIRVGQDFSGAAFPFTSTMISSMRHISQAGDDPIAAREGDRPAVVFEAEQSGLHRIMVETKPAYIVFDDLGEFTEYLAYEGLEVIAAQHLTRKLPETEIAEAYIRNAKALVQVGPFDVSQSDARSDVPIEIVALGSPFDPELNEMTFELVWFNKPVSGTQISVFYLPAGGTAPTDSLRTTIETDSNGQATIDISEPGAYLLNAVRMEPVSGPGSVRWKSHWASLTFTNAK